MKKEYAIVDIETTGHFSPDGGITEIAIVVTDGERIISTYETLINPQAKIPPFVENLTGITNEMVKSAPLFEEVAMEIYTMLVGRVFVAHNVNFDYKFVKYELEKCNIPIGQERLCTVRLSRKILHGLKSYSLGKLTKELGIKHTDKHRAMSDTMATAELFHLLIQKGEKDILDTLKKVKKQPNLPAHLPERVFNKLPNESGVYYFLNDKREVIYVGKAKNIKKRVASHFTGKATAQKMCFYREIHHVDTVLTGTEMIASLLEDAEIKRLWPIYNRSQKSRVNKFGVFVYENQKGVKQLGITKIGTRVQPLKTFPSLSGARNWLLKQIEGYELNPRLCGMPEFELNQVNEKQHVKNIENFLANYDKDYSSYILIGQGREEEELSYVLIEKGTYRGYGFVSKKAKLNSLHKIKKHLHLQEETTTNLTILKSEKLGQGLIKKEIK